MDTLTSKTADAAALGSARAEREFQAGAHAPTADAAPLSGEWAGDLTSAELLARLDVRDPFDGDAICEAYEDAYFGTWQGLMSDV